MFTFYFLLETPYIHSFLPFNEVRKLRRVDAFIISHCGSFTYSNNVKYNIRIIFFFGYNADAKKQNKVLSNFQISNRYNIEIIILIARNLKKVYLHNLPKISFINIYSYLGYQIVFLYEFF